MEEVLHHTPFCRDGTGEQGSLWQASAGAICNSLHRDTALSSHSSSPPCPVDKGHYLHRTLTGSDRQTVSFPTAPDVGRNRECPSTNNISLTVLLRIVVFKAIYVFNKFPSVCHQVSNPVPEPGRNVHLGPPAAPEGTNTHHPYCCIPRRYQCSLREQRSEIFTQFACSEAKVSIAVCIGMAPLASFLQKEQKTSKPEQNRAPDMASGGGGLPEGHLHRAKGSDPARSQQRVGSGASSAAMAGTVTDGGAIQRMRAGNQQPPEFRDSHHWNTPRTHLSISF